MPAIVNIKTLKGRLIAHKFSTGWAVGVVKSVEKKKSVSGQFAVEYKSETYCWTQKLNKEDYGVLGTSCCCERINTVAKQKTLLR